MVIGWLWRDGDTTAVGGVLLRSNNSSLTWSFFREEKDGILKKEWKKKAKNEAVSGAWDLDGFPASTEGLRSQLA